MSEHDGGEQVDGIENPMTVLRISPEPSEEELAAIASAVLALSRSWRTHDDDAPPPDDRWRMAGRREAMRPLLRHQ